MDHLPYPSEGPEPIQPQIQIPLLFSSFVSPWTFTVKSKDISTRVRYATSHYIQPILDLPDPHSKSIRIQENVYFGFLSGLLGSAFDMDDFLSCDEATGAKSVTISKLEGILEQTDKIGGRMTNLEQDLIRDFYLVVHLVENNPSFQNLSDDEESVELDKVILSLLCLRWTLSAIYFQDEYIGCKSSLMRNRMKAAGWCPYWATIHLSRQSIPLIYYLSAYPLQSKSKGCSETTCCCNISDDNTKARHSEHCPGSGICQPLGFDTDQIKTIIEGGGVPMIRVSVSNSGEITHLQPHSLCLVSNLQLGRTLYIELIEYKPGMRFTAISHVWSGGLGNQNSNVLPECQLWELYKSCYIGEHKSHIWERLDDVHSGCIILWMDTLCIPTCCFCPHNANPTEEQKTHQKTCLLSQAKRKAIDSMVFVYSASENVVVLDLRIQKVKFEKLTDMEIASAMLCCPWMQRSWTFQEACLAQEFWFVLQDRLISPRRWFGRWVSYWVRTSGVHNTIYPDNVGIFPADRSRTVLEMRLKFECLASLRAICGSIVGTLENLSFSDYDVEQDHRDLMMSVEAIYHDTFDITKFDALKFFSHVWNSLATRLTTMPEDVQSILAVMLGLSVDEVYGKFDRIGPGHKQTDEGSPLEKHKITPAQEGLSKRVVGRTPTERILAILLSQSCLPLMMITHTYSSQAKLCTGAQWIPTAPAMFINANNSRSEFLPLSFDDGIMTWNNDTGGWEWAVEDTGSVFVMYPAGNDFSGSFLLALPMGIVNHTKITLCQSRADDILKMKSSVIGFFLHNYIVAGKGHGTCFKVLESTIDRPGAKSLQFICPLEWNDCGSGSHSECGLIKDGGTVLCNLSCILPIDNVPALRTGFRRPRPSYLQIRPVAIVKSIIGAIWIVIPGLTIACDKRLRWCSESLPFPFLKRFRDTLWGRLISRQHFIVRWLAYLLVLPTLNLYALCVDFAMPFGVRLASFEGGEGDLRRRVEGTYRTRLLEQGFYGSKIKDLLQKAKENHGQTLLFQYPTRWEIARPFLISSLCFLSTSKSFSFSQLLVDKFPAVTKLVRSCGTSLLVETVIRIASEYVWRKWWFDKNDTPPLQTPRIDPKKFSPRKRENSDDDEDNDEEDSVLDVALDFYRRFDRFLFGVPNGPAGIVGNYRGDIRTH